MIGIRSSMKVSILLLVLQFDLGLGRRSLARKGAHKEAGVDLQGHPVSSFLGNPTGEEEEVPRKKTGVTTRCWTCKYASQCGKKGDQTHTNGFPGSGWVLGCARKKTGVTTRCFTCTDASRCEEGSQTHTNGFPGKGWTPGCASSALQASALQTDSADETPHEDKSPPDETPQHFFENPLYEPPVPQDLENFIAQQTKSGDACHARMFEAKQTLDHLLHDVHTLNLKVDSHETSLVTLNEELSVTKLSMDAITESYEKELEKCGKEKGEALKELEQYRAELKELEQIANPSVTYEPAGKLNTSGSLLQTQTKSAGTFSSSHCVAFLQFVQNRKPLEQSHPDKVQNGIGCAARTHSQPCHLVTSRDACLTSTDSRDSWLLDTHLLGQLCVWCPGPCSANGELCQPKDWLDIHNPDAALTYETCLSTLNNTVACDTQREKLQEVFTETYTAIHKLTQEAEDRSTDHTCNAAADATKITELTPITMQREKISVKIEEASQAISGLEPVLDMAKQRTKMMEQHIETVLKPECAEAEEVSKMLQDVRDLIVSVEQCPGFKRLKLKIPETASTTDKDQDAAKPEILKPGIPDQKKD